MRICIFSHILLEKISSFSLALSKRSQNTAQKRSIRSYVLPELTTSCSCAQAEEERLRSPACYSCERDSEEAENISRTLWKDFLAEEQPGSAYPRDDCTALRVDGRRASGRAPVGRAGLRVLIQLCRCTTGYTENVGWYMILSSQPTTFPQSRIAAHPRCRIFRLLHTASSAKPSKAAAGGQAERRFPAAPCRRRAQQGQRPPLYFF